MYKTASGSDLQVVDLDADLEAGDLCWVETPVNPTGEARDIQHYTTKAHRVGATVVVDSTFAPPPLQDPFKWGADLVMHSGMRCINYWTVS